MIGVIEIRIQESKILKPGWKVVRISGLEEEMMLMKGIENCRLEYWISKKILVR